MDVLDFTDQAPGTLVWIPEGTYGLLEGAHAFVPNPLLTTLTLEARTVKLLGDARGALGELIGVAQGVADPLWVRPFIRREAISSNIIEGTITTMEQLSLYEARPTDEQSQTREVANYTIALEYGLARLADLPISLRLFRELHEKLMAGARGGEHAVGDFRTKPVMIGQFGDSISDARFVPPPPDQMLEALYALEQYLHQPTDLPTLVKLALIHYQFETIHPFEDGNGRMGRLLIPLQMVQEGLLPGPLLYLSSFFERNRDEYMDRLLRVSQNAEWVPWVEFFLIGVAQQARHAVGRANALLALRDGYRVRLQRARGSALLLSLVDDLFKRPVTMIGLAQQLLNVTPRSAQLNIEKLVAQGILREVTGSARNRVYLAEEIINTANES